MTQKMEKVMERPGVRREGGTRGCHTEESPRSVVNDGATQQERVTAHFESTADRWKSLYESEDIFARMHQQRLAAALRFVDRVLLVPHAQILEVGCGAGLAAVSLAERGHFVEAVDIAPAMLQSTQERAARAGVTHRISTSRGDIHQLPFPNNKFDVVLAIGITAWLDSLHGPLREAARVLRPGGHLVVSAGNRWSLHRLLDPRLSPALAEERRMVRRVLHLESRKLKPGEARYNFYSPQEFDAILAMANLTKLQSATIGFGPFSLMGHKVLPDSSGVSIDRYLQRLADKNFPFIRSAGRVYLVLAKKPDLTNRSSKSSSYYLTEVNGVKHRGAKTNC